MDAQRTNDDETDDGADAYRKDNVDMSYDRMDGQRTDDDDGTDDGTRRQDTRAEDQ